MKDMASFECNICGAFCQDTEDGYLSGCRHWPPDEIPGASVRCENCKLSFSDRTNSFSWILETGLCWLCDNDGEDS